MSHPMIKKVESNVRNSSSSRTTSALFIFALSLTAFFIGQFYGYHGGLVDFNQQCFEDRRELTKAEDSTSLVDGEIMNEAIRRVNAVKDDKTTTNKNNKNNEEEKWQIPSSLSFDEKTAKFASGIARVDKDEFTTAMDFGYPILNEQSDALILYNYKSSLPTGYAEMAASRGDPLPKFEVQEAVENCEAVNVITTANPGNLPQCLAIMGKYESYHVQRWLRVDPDKGGKVDHKFDLTPVSRGLAPKGRSNFLVPRDRDLERHWDFLRTYFNNLDSVLNDIKQITDRIQKDNTIVVLTCNFGQSELLMNFICSARARGLDISNVLLFATDIETKELAESLGLNAYYDEYNFEKMPKHGANHYGDRYFTAMMVSKVICVQLVNMLGYDVLFQDVDIVWWRDPMEYFKGLQNDNFDIYFQDDGAYQVRYAPLSANSGFYFIRNNQKTKFLFSSLLLLSDVIIQSGSHQQVLVSTLNEHISLFNLRVKIMSREEFNFPGGYHYHRQGQTLKKMFQNKLETKPYLFHMSWTENKDNKLKFLQQMGEWFLNEQCIAKEKKDIINIPQTDTNESPGTPDLVDLCCLPEPKITCHYRDKPSKIPCKNAVAIDGRPSFW